MSETNGVHKPPTKKEGVAFDDKIPNVGPEIFILRMKANRMLTFNVWGTQIRGIWVHWAGSRSVPHFHNEETCPGCLKRQEKRWKGFLHCYCYEMKQEVFLELTPASARSLRDQFAPEAPMRGARIQVKRTAAENGRLYISLLTPVTVTDAIPAEKDPRPSILRLWGVAPDEAEEWVNGETGTGDEARFT